MHPHHNEQRALCHRSRLARGTALHGDSIIHHQTYRGNTGNVRKASATAERAALAAQGSRPTEMQSNQV